MANVVLLVLAWLGMQVHAGSSFTQAAYFLQNHAAAIYTKLTSVGVGPQAFAVMLSDPITKVVIAVGFLGWLLPGPSSSAWGRRASCLRSRSSGSFRSGRRV